VLSYKVQHVFNDENQPPLDEKQLELPETAFTTHGCWLLPPLEAVQAATQSCNSLSEVMQGVMNLWLALAPSILVCEPSDVSGKAMAASEQLGGPVMFMYDMHAGTITH
jgi:hypothetical protein